MSGQRNLEGSTGMASSHQLHCPSGISLLGPHSNWLYLQYSFPGLGLLTKWKCSWWHHFHFVSAERLQCNSSLICWLQKNFFTIIKHLFIICTCIVFFFIKGHKYFRCLIFVFVMVLFMADPKHKGQNMTILLSADCVDLVLYPPKDFLFYNYKDEI